VPQHIEFLSALPKIGNGKVDRQSLRCRPLEAPLVQ
jgi:hypothetical protein